MTRPLISILMSVHNGSAYLREAIDSVLSQTFTDFEFLIIEDASTDDSLAIIKSYADPRINIIENAQNIGLTRSLNIGLSLARGEYVARLDADDACLPERLRLQAECLDRTGAAVCFCRATIEDEVLGQTEEWKESEWPLTLWRGLFRNSYGIHSAMMARRNILNAVSGYDPHFLRAQDYDLFDRTAATGAAFAYVNEPLVVYRRRKEGISQLNTPLQAAFADEISARALRRVLPDLSSSEILGLHWIFCSAGVPPGDGVEPRIERCWELANTFIKANGLIASQQAIWEDITSRISGSFGLFPSRHVKAVAFGILFRALLRARSLRSAKHVLKAICQWR